MAEQIPYGVAVGIINRLASSAFREIGQIYGVESELENLQETLNSIKFVLSDAEKKRHDDKEAEHWIKRFKEVLHEADDLLDDLATKQLQREVDGRGEIVKKVSDFFSSPKQLVFRRKIAHKINKIWERFNRVAKDMSMLNLNQEIIVIQQNENDWRETSSWVNQFEIVGREGNKNEIVKELFKPNSNQNVTLVAITGMGGLGKTTLAQLVYNDGEVMKFFQKRMWVYVSETSGEKSLVKKILESSTNDEVPDLQLELLQNRLRESLNGQKFLLVLDDVWNEEHKLWNQLRNYLMRGAQGSKILVTTRNRIVAETMGVDVSYNLEGLTEEESWALFEKLAFRESARKMNPNFVSIGQKIAKKCGGVPLAVRTVGSLLQSRREESEWETILESNFGKLCHEQDIIMPVLKLSYNHLPIELRQCFAYCSLYPKGWRINKEQLIQLWMAQGYLQSRIESQSMDEIGNQYIKILLMRSFFQDVETDQYGDIVSFKMHDLLHDLAQLVAGGDCCLYTSERRNIGRPMHASFEFGALFEFGAFSALDLLNAKKLRTIIWPLEWPLLVQLIDPCVLSRFKRLRVLYLSHSVIIKLPKSVGKLKHLRYLNLSNCNMLKSLPRSIGNLVNLQTLDLSGCRQLRSLPKSFTKLISLKHLICENDSPISSMVQVGLGDLTSLQYLSEVEFVVGNNTANGIATLNKLKDLNDLRGDLHIKNLRLVQDVTSESNEVNLNRKRYIKNLTLDWGDHEDNKNSDLRGDLSELEKEILNWTRSVKSLMLDWADYEDNKNSDSLQLLDNLHPHQNLKSLTVLMYPGVGFSNWISSLSNVVFISLVGFKNCYYLPPLEGLPSLKSLAIQCMDALEYIYIESYQESSPTAASSSLLMPTRVFFPSLQSLQVIKCPNLCGWKWIHQQHQLDLLLPPFPRLSSLSIADCGNLTVLMYPGVRFSNWLSSLTNVVSIHLSKFKNIRYLPPLEGLASLKSLVIEYMDALEYICFESYQEISSTTASSSLAMPTGVFFPSLERLEFNECPNLLGWKCKHQQHQQDLLLPPFPRLSSLRITDCGNLTCMPTFPYLVEEMTFLASNVKPLMDTLVMNTVTSTATQEGSVLALESSFSTSLSKLQSMTIAKTKIEALPDGWIRGLTSLEILSIEGFDSLASVFPSMGHLPATLKHLTVSKVDDVSIPWNDHEGASSNTTQHQVIHNPPTLKSIDFTCCNLFTLPEWVCHISSLRSISIINHQNAFYPPEGMRRLTNLQTLFCSSMEDTDEVRSRIVHIPHITVAGKVFLV